MQQGYQAQYQHLLQTYGRDCANRYHAVIHGQPPQRSTRQRWISNTIHRTRAFTDIQAQVIRAEYSSGLTCRDLARRWGTSQGTISAVISHRGAYRDR